MLMCFGSVKAQSAIKFDSGFIDKPCEIDTIKGIIYFQGTWSTSATIIEGYYIAPCGGIQVGNFYGYDNVPTFIPAYFIRNDEMIKGKRQINTYTRQRNSGYFTDNKFKKIPIKAIYGMVVIDKKQNK